MNVLLLWSCSLHLSSLSCYFWVDGINDKNKLAKSHACEPAEFSSMCDSQLFTLTKEVYLVLASSSSDGKVSGPAFVTQHDEPLPWSSVSPEAEVSGVPQEQQGAKKHKQREWVIVKGGEGRYPDILNHDTWMHHYHLNETTNTLYYTFLCDWIPKSSGVALHTLVLLVILL